MRVSSSTDARQYLAYGLRCAVRPLLVSGIYVILFACLGGLGADLQAYPELSPWNMSLGLSFGLLLGYGLGYTPIVFALHVLPALQPNIFAITNWRALVLALSMTLLYALATLAIRWFIGTRHIDLTNRKAIAAFIVSVPVIATMACGAFWLAAMTSWQHLMDGILRAAVGNITGILLVAPCVVLSSGWLGPWLDSLSGNLLGAIRDRGQLPTITRRSLTLLAGILLYLIFASRLPIMDAFLLLCVVSIPLVALSLRFGLHGTALCLGVLAFMTIRGTGMAYWTGMTGDLVIIVSALNGIVLGSLVTERDQQRTRIGDHAALLNSVSYVTEQLLGMTDREKNVNEVLRHLATEANVSRIYVLENRHDIDGAECPVLYECSASTTSGQEHFQQVNMLRSRLVQSHADAFGQDQALQFRTADLSKDEQEPLLAVGIRVGIILPIFADGRWWGCLGLDQTSTARLWSEPEVNAFKATAHVLGALLAHANVEQQFRQFTGMIPAVFWIASANGVRKTYVSPAYEQIWGRSCEDIYSKPDSWIGAIYHEDYARVRAALDEKRGGEYDEEYRIVRPDREVRWIRDTAFPVRDASGQVSRVVGIAQDITPQKEAEERLRANSILLAALIDNLPVGIVVEDHSRRVMHVNQALCRMFDVTAPRESIAGMDSRIAFKQQDLFGERVDEIKQGIARRGQEIVTSDGRIFSRDYIPLSVDGGCHYHLSQYEDITERTRSQERTKTSLKEKEVLLKEIHHRVKNNLQIISSLLNLQSTKIRDAHTAQVFKDSQSRVRAMALVHERLYQSADLARIDFAGYVRDVTSHLLRSYQTAPNGIRLKLDVDPVSLNIDTAIPCALIINELVSNALKYAFPNGRDGEIHIRLEQRTDERLHLVISDNGVGFPAHVSFDTTDSLGLHLVRSLAEQLNGSVQYRHVGGTQFEITFRALTNEGRNWQQENVSA